MTQETFATRPGESTVLADARTVHVNGYSDDTFGAYWEQTGIDDDDCAAGSRRWLRVVFPDGSGFMFCGQHAGAGPERAGWTIGVAPLSEDLPTTVALTCAQVQHTMRFTFEAPAGTRLSLSRAVEC